MCTIQKYLDTLSSSKRAVHLYEKAGFEQTERYNDNYTADHLYEKAGFEQTERYNDNYTADIFMVLNLDK